MRSGIVSSLCALCISCALPPAQVDLVVRAEGTVPSSAGAAPVGGLERFNGFSSAFSQELSAEGLPLDKLESVKVVAFVITVVSEGGSLTSWDSASFFAEADGVARARIATRTGFPKLTRYEFDVDDLELLPYLATGAMKVTAEIPPTSRRPLIAVDFEVAATLRARVRP